MGVLDPCTASLSRVPAGVNRLRRTGPAERGTEHDETSLTPLHRDPADRIIIATSLITGVSILTPDRQISQYPDVSGVWGSG